MTDPLHRKATSARRRFLCLAPAMAAAAGLLSPFAARVQADIVAGPSVGAPVAAAEAGAPPGVTPDDPTAEWPSYLSPVYGWEIKYPPDWTLIAPTIGVSEAYDRTEIRKDAREYYMGLLFIESGNNVPEANARRMTQLNIDGLLQAPRAWVAPPSVAERGIAGGTADVVEGIGTNGLAVTEIFLWADGTWVNLAWFDTEDRTDQQTYELMVSTFRFVPGAPKLPG